MQHKSHSTKHYVTSHRQFRPYMLCTGASTDCLYHKEGACKLTIHLRYCGKIQEKDRIFQRSLSYPVCCHKTAASLTPERNNTQRKLNIYITQPQVLNNDTQYDPLLSEQVIILTNRMVKSDSPLLCAMFDSLYFKYYCLIIVNIFSFSTSDRYIGK